MAAGLPIVQLELRVAEVAKAAGFLRAALGWWVTPVAGVEPALYEVDSGALPLLRLREADAGEAGAMTPWVLTDDLVGLAARAAELGAAVGCVCGGGEAGLAVETRDPWGHGLVFWQPGAPFAPRFVGDASHPVAWVEWPVPNLAGAVKYYRQLCGWVFQMSLQVEGFAYSTEPDRRVGVGLVGGGRAGAASGPTAYVRTADIDLAVARVGFAGGHTGRSALRGPQGEKLRAVTGPGGNLLGLMEAGRG